MFRVFALSPLLASVAMASTCTPRLILEGVAEAASNPTNTPFIIKSQCGQLDTTSHAVFLRGSSGIAPYPELSALLDNTTISPDGITVDGFDSGDKVLTVAATDYQGHPLLATFVLNFGGEKPQTSSVDRHSPLTRIRTASGCSPCNRSASCPSAPMSQPACQNPPRETCTFYRACAEATLHCGPDSYPLRYGDKNCNRFKANQDSFTAQGQKWIWDVGACLQKTLIAPVQQCSMTCDKLTTTAFDSHPRCYVDSGVCDLPLSDLVELVITVNTDLFYGPAIQQILGTATGCIEHYVQEIEDKIGELRDAIKHDIFHTP